MSFTVLCLVLYFMLALACSDEGEATRGDASGGVDANLVASDGGTGGDAAAVVDDAGVVVVRPDVCATTLYCVTGRFTLNVAAMDQTQVFAPALNQEITFAFGLDQVVFSQDETIMRTRAISGELELVLLGGPETPVRNPLLANLSAASSAALIIQTNPDRIPRLVSFGVVGPGETRFGLELGGMVPIDVPVTASGFAEVAPFEVDASAFARRFDSSGVTDIYSGPAHLRWW